MSISAPIRAFIALNFSVPATRRLAEAAAEIRKQASAGSDAPKLAWVPSANLHVTLKFLGEVDADIVEAVAPRLRRTLTAIQPFEVRAVGMGGFPSLTDGPRVLWFGVEGGATLTALHTQIENDMFELGFAREDLVARPFTPHVTIGRVMAEATGRLPSLTLAKPEIATSRVTEVVLYESRSHHQGAEYVALARMGLGSAAQLAI